MFGRTLNYYKNKVVIVTGGASGLGRSLCEELGRYGAKVVVTDINEQGAKDVARSIKSSGGTAEAMRLDVSKQKDVEAVINKTAEKYGRLDLMFNNAGIAIIGELRDMNTEKWNRIISINLMGVIYGTSAAYQIMIDQGYGHIINISSLAGIVPFVGSNAYGVAKHGVYGLSRGLRTEAAGLGVRVSVVCPGAIKTNMFNSATMLKMKHDDFFGLMRFEPMDSRRAAKIILRRVSKNRGIIVLTASAHILRLINRLCPAAVDLISRVPVWWIRKNVRK